MFWYIFFGFMYFYTTNISKPKFVKSVYIIEYFARKGTFFSYIHAMFTVLRGFVYYHLVFILYCLLLQVSVFMLHRWQNVSKRQYNPYWHTTIDHTF